MPWYGCRHANALPPRLHGAWWACTTCLPDFVPACSLCAAPAPVIDRAPGWLGYAYGRLCPACVAKVKAAGPWKERRARAVAARRDALLERFPGLRVVKSTAAVTQLEGEIEGRQVEVRLRVKNREHDYDRYVFHVELDRDRDPPDAAALALPEPLAPLLATGSPTAPVTRVRWLRVAFRHLGKLDTVRALEHLVAWVRHPPDAAANDMS
ncbi:MAG: hypothetical protein H6710_14970 [Myxococcales bacterium]|nr:hypothetical protein [Myxococcales bacterium]